MPHITWGGDIHTVHANGGKAVTTQASIFGKAGLSLKLGREDVFAKQLDAYLRCDTPYLRGTAGMTAMAAAAANRDPRTKMVVVYQLTWSAGGDALVIKGGICSPKDLKGKTVALQSYAPHVDYLGKVLADSGLSLKDVRLKWVKDHGHGPDSGSRLERRGRTRPWSSARRHGLDPGAPWHPRRGSVGAHASS